MKNKVERNALYIAKKNELASIIKKIGRHYGENIDDLKEYFNEILEKHDIDKALNCFKDVAEMIKYSKPIV
jgi:Flp pilus assembly CpaF family ATPase